MLPLGQWNPGESLLLLSVEHPVSLFRLQHGLVARLSILLSETSILQQQLLCLSFCLRQASCSSSCFCAVQMARTTRSTQAGRRLAFLEERAAAVWLCAFTVSFYVRLRTFFLTEYFGLFFPVFLLCFFQAFFFE